jgi:hypothetical protein
MRQIHSAIPTTMLDTQVSCRGSKLIYGKVCLGLVFRWSLLFRSQNSLLDREEELKLKTWPSSTTAF